MIAAALAIVAGVLVFLFLWYSSQMVEPSAIRELPEADRRALFERTLRTLATSCDPEAHPEGLARFCREQAEFVVQFPECDEACRKLAKPHQPKATR